MALIDRDTTLERMKSMAGCATCDNYNYVRCRACIWDDAMNIVEEMSEVDAVPVIRCKDCKHWGVVDGCNWMTCRKGILTGWSNKGYGYCSYGERKSNIEGN